MILRIIVALRENKRNEKEYYSKLGNQKFVKNKYKLIHLLLSVTEGKGITRNPILGI